MKKTPSKVAHNWPNQPCQPAQNQPKSQFLFHKNCSLRDLCLMTLLTAKRGKYFCSSWYCGSYVKKCLFPFHYPGFDVEVAEIFLNGTYLVFIAYFLYFLVKPNSDNYEVIERGCDNNTFNNEPECVFENVTLAIIGKCYCNERGAKIPCNLLKCKYRWYILSGSK